MTLIRRVVGSVAFYPVTLTYIAGVAMMALAVAGKIRVDVAVLASAVFACLAVVIALDREVRTVHRLVNSQHDVLIARVKQLVDALVAAGVTIPTEPHPGGKR